MTLWLGDLAVDSVVSLPFSTHEAAGGNVAPSSAFEIADIRVYKGASATQRSSSSGMTMTSPFDSMTGVHMVEIDTSDDTDTGFFAAGNLYHVMLAPDETVDSQTLTGVHLASFGIEYSAIHSLLSTVLSRLGSPSNLGGGASVAGNLSDIYDVADSVSSNVGAAGAGLTAITDLIGTPTNLGSGATVAGNLVDIEAQTDDIGVAGAGLTALGDTRLANLDAAVSSRSTYAGGDTSGTTTLLSRVVGTIASGTHNAQSGDSYARLGAPAGASVSADVAAVKAQTAAIETDTQDLQTQIGTDGAGLTAIGDTRLANLDATVSSRLATAGYTAPLDAAGIRTAVGMSTNNLDTQLAALPTDADVQTAAAAALTAYDPPTKAELDSGFAGLNDPTAAAVADAVWDEAIGGHTSAGSTSKALIDVLDDTSTSLPLAIASITPQSAADIRAEMDANSTKLAAIVADTNELQTNQGNWLTADVSALATAAALATVDGIVDDILVDTGTTLPGTLATIAGYVDTEVAAILAAVDTEVAAIKAKTDNLPAAPAATGDIPTAAAVADAVWDEAIAGHAGVGSTGEALTAAGSAGDPWATALPGAYGSGTAGKIIGDNINATVSSRASQTSVDDLPTNAELASALASADDATLAAIGALNNLSSAQAQTAAAAALTAYDPPTKAELDNGLAALNDLDATAVQAAAAAALAAYDPPTNAEMVARTLLAASYFDPATDTVARVTLVDTTTTNTDMVAAAPSAATVADAVWDEALSGHAAAGSTGAALTAASAAGDPWSTALPGAYGAGTAGKLLSDIEAVAPDNKPTIAATGEASANVTLWAGDAVGDAPVSAVGNGAISFPVTVNDEDSNPIDGVEVWITTDSGGTNVVAGTLSTDALGVATFMLDAGDYYVWRQASGYNFTNPVAITVS